MNRVKVAAGLIGLALCVALALYLAGVFYFISQKINPLNVGLLTWFNYWRAYGINLPGLAMSMVFALAIVVGLVVAFIINGRKIPLHGESRFASYPEIRAAGLTTGQGIIVGKHAGKFLQFGGMQHVSLMAPTRSGKGVGIVIPNLLSYPDSVVCLDVKLENWSITSKFRAEHGQDTYLFNPFSTNTHRYNPLEYVSTDPHKRPAEVLAIGYMLYPRGDDRNSMWSDTARDLFVGICLYLLETPNTVASIGGALRIASGNGGTLAQHLTDLIHSRNYDAVTTKGDDGNPVTYKPKPPYDGTGLPHLTPNCVDALNRFISAPGNTAGGILTTFNASLTLWASPITDAATSGNDFDLRQLRKRRTSIYVGIPVNKISEASVLLRLFFSQLIQLNTNELFGVDGNTVPCLLLMDEMMAPRYLPAIAEGAPYIAGYGLRLLSIAQSKAQVSKPVSEGGYGREGATGLFTNHAMNIMYTPKELADANEYSETLGYDTVKSQSRQLRTRWHGTESDQKRALMMPQELQRMPQTKQLIQLEGVRPIMCGKIRYYNDRVFIDRLKSVAPSLARLDQKQPTEKQLQAAWSSGELSAPVPTVNVNLFEAKRYDRKRAMKASDVAGRVDLEAIAVDLSGVQAPEGEPMTDDDVQNYVEKFFSALEPETVNFDLETGEWLGDGSDDVEAVDLNQLQQA